jgi:serine/threonine-protein kinase
METLASRIARDGALTTSDAVGWILRLARTLELTHTRGGVHGRISPHCLLIDGESCTAAGQLVGRDHAPDLVAYYSPERVAGEAPSVVDDTWAAAATLYEAICGKPPFKGTSDGDTRAKITAGQLVPLAKFGVTDQALQVILDRALGQDWDRTQNIAALRRDLEGWRPDAPFADLPPLEESPEALSSPIVPASTVPAAIPRPKDSGPKLSVRESAGQDADEPPTITAQPKDTDLRRRARDSDEEHPTVAYNDPDAPPSSRARSAAAAGKKDSTGLRWENSRDVRRRILGGGKHGAPDAGRRPGSEEPRSGAGSAGAMGPTASDPSQQALLNADSQPTVPLTDLLAADAAQRALLNADSQPTVPLTSLVGADAELLAQIAEKHSLPSPKEVPRRLPPRPPPAPSPSAPPASVPRASAPPTSAPRASAPWSAGAPAPWSPVSSPPASAPASWPSGSSPRASAPWLQAQTAPDPVAPYPASGDTPSVPLRAKGRLRTAILLVGVALLVVAGIVFALQRRNASPTRKVAAAPSATALPPKASVATTPATPPPIDTNACVRPLFADGTFGAESPPDFSYICQETDPRRGGAQLKKQVMLASKARLNDGLREWAMLNWYEMAAFAVMRARCCPAAAPPLTLPPPSGSCDPLERRLNELSAAALEATDANAEKLKGALNEYTKAVHCFLRTGTTAPFEWKTAPPGGADTAFLKTLARVTASHR